MDGLDVCADHMWSCWVWTIIIPNIQSKLSIGFSCGHQMAWSLCCEQGAHLCSRFGVYLTFFNFDNMFSSWHFFGEFIWLRLHAIGVMMLAFTRFKDFFVNLFPLYALAYFLGASSSSFAYQDSFAFSSFPSHEILDPRGLWMVWMCVRTICGHVGSGP